MYNIMDYPKQGNGVVQGGSRPWAAVLLIGKERTDDEILVAALKKSRVGISRAYRSTQIPRLHAPIAFQVIVFNGPLIDEDGLGVLSRLAPVANNVCVIYRAETDEEIDRVIALESGADDCIGQSCGAGELAVKIRAILRRRDRQQRYMISPPSITDRVYKGWVICAKDRCLVTPSAQIIPITEADYAMIDCLLFDAGSIKDRSVMQGGLSKIVGAKNLRSVDVAVSRLRKKMTKYGDRSIIQTVRGHGYRLT